MKKAFLTLYILASILLPDHASAAESRQDDPERSMGEWLWHYFTDGASISVGLGGRAISLEAKRVGTEDRGKLIDNDEEAFFLSYNLKASYFDHSNYGYSWMFNLSSFELHKQEVAPEVHEDLGTRVEGAFAYAVPTFFYNWGDKYDGDHFRIGVGLGLGITQFHGDIVLTESSKPNDRVTISNGPSNLYLALGLSIEAQYGYFTVRLANAGPNLEYNGYQINIADTSLMLGITYPFD